jgi:hemerythrin-like domain-containing protein
MPASDNSGKAMDTMTVDANDPVKIILTDHEQITKMIAQLNQSLDTNNSEKKAQFKSLRDFVVKHETMEQKAWYPALEKYEQLKSIISNLKDQEKAADNALKNIDKAKDDQEWASKVKDFLKDVEKHAQNEQTELLPKVNQVVDKEKLNKIGKEMQAFRTKNNMH